MDIHKLIAGLSPETYCQPESAKQVRRLLRQKDTVSPPEAVLLAAAPAEPKPANLLPLQRLEKMDPFDCPGLKSPRSQFHFSRDAMAESIEAFYFSILNSLEELEGWQVFKLVDEFQASLLASPFADAAKQQSLIQRQVFEGLQAIHVLTQDMIQTVQQLETKPLAAGAEASATGASHSSNAVELHRARLRSQLSLLKLRAATIGPWLQRGSITASHQDDSPSLVTAFNTTVFQVVLLAVGPDVVRQAVETGELPKWMSRKGHRAYRPVLVLELRFRARPHRSRSQGHAYRGKAELVLASYGLHDQELSVLRQAVQASLLRDSLQMGAGEATDALDHWVHRIEHLVQPQPPSPEDQHSDDINPFSGLVSLLKMLYQWFAGKSVRQAPADAAHLDPDTPLESVGRSIAILQAMQRGHDLYNHLRRQTE